MFRGLCFGRSCKAPLSGSGYLGSVMYLGSAGGPPPPLFPWTGWPPSPPCTCLYRRTWGPCLRRYRSTEIHFMQLKFPGPATPPHGPLSICRGLQSFIQMTRPGSTLTSTCSVQVRPPPPSTDSFYAYISTRRGSQVPHGCRTVPLTMLGRAFPFLRLHQSSAVHALGSHRV